MVSNTVHDALIQGFYHLLPSENGILTDHPNGNSWVTWSTSKNIPWNHSVLINPYISIPRCKPWCWYILMLTKLWGYFLMGSMGCTLYFFSSTVRLAPRSISKKIQGTRRCISDAPRASNNTCSVASITAVHQFLKRNLQRFTFAYVYIYILIYIYNQRYRYPPMKTLILKDIDSLNPIHI